MILFTGQINKFNKKSISFKREHVHVVAYKLHLRGQTNCYVI